MIPKKIHFTYISNDLPLGYQNNLKKWEAAYPDWEINFYSDELVQNFFDHYFPEYASDIPKIPYGAMKADFFRYAILYIQGGMYTDIDTVPVKKIPDEWLLYQCALGYEYQPSKFPEMFRRPYLNNEVLCQWTMLSSPQFPLFKEALDQAFENLRQKKFQIENIEEALKSAGPLHLTSVAKKYMDRDDILILDADFFACNQAYNFELTDRSCIYHQSDGCRGWILKFAAPQINLKL